MNRIAKTTLCFLIAASAQMVQAWQIISGGPYNAWQASLTDVSSVSAQINLYFQNLQQPNAGSYAVALPGLMKNKLFSEMLMMMNTSDLANSICRPQSMIDFPVKLFSNSPAYAQDFEKEVLAVRTLDCLPELNLDKVFNTLMSDDFQKQSIKGLKAISSNQTTNLVCQQTKVFGIGKSDYCFTQHIWKDTDTYVIHSFNETNKAGIESPVYFREVITVLKKLKNNQIVFFNLAYGRGPDLSFHGIVKNVVKKQQVELVNALVSESQKP